MSENRHEDRPPGADTAKRARVRARARRVRYGVVGIAAAALIAGLATCSTPGGDGGDGNTQMATQPTVPERAEQATGESGSAGAGGEPATAGREPTDTSPVEPAADKPSPVDQQPAHPPSADLDGEAEDAESGSVEPDSSFLTPEELSTGPTLTWTEVSLDASPGISDIYGLMSVGDGRIAARAGVEAGDPIVVTDDGTTWTTVPTPARIAPELGDIAGSRWVVAGVDASGPERTDRVFYSDDEGATWTELTIDVGSGAGPLPSHCVTHSRVTAVLASGDRMVAVVETYTDLDLHESLVSSGRAPDRDSILYWRYTDSALVVYLGETDDAESIEVPFDELGLAPGQPAPCAGPDGRHDQRVHILTSDGAGTEPVGRHDGVNTAAISTAEGFFITLRTGVGDLLLTSPDGRTWTEHAISEQGYVPVTRGPDGAAWRSARSYDSYGIERLEVGRGPGSVAVFEGLRPGPILTAGPAGVVTTAEPIPGAGTGSRQGIRVVKDGYELLLDQAWGDLALRDLAADVAVYQFAAPEITFRASPPEGLRFVTEDDGSQTLVFEDPDTGDDLVAFTDADLERAAAELPAEPVALEPPPTWIGWSADGGAWGWQNVVDAFGIDTGPIYPAPIELAVGDDFVLARVPVVTGGGEVDPSPPQTSDVRWFIATVP